jgi:hypothetical protein
VVSPRPGVRRPGRAVPGGLPAAASGASALLASGVVRPIRARAGKTGRLFCRLMGRQGRPWALGGLTGVGGLPGVFLFLVAKAARSLGFDFSVYIAQRSYIQYLKLYYRDA